jgi:hypothetical protein
LAGPKTVAGDAAISAVVMAKARPHTAESINSARLVDDPANNFGLWLWVLDRASLAQDDSGVFSTGSRASG